MILVPVPDGPSCHEVYVQHLKSPYPLVRWTDRWGQRWEHRLGEVRRIPDDEPWHLLSEVTDRYL